MCWAMFIYGSGYSHGKTGNCLVPKGFVKLLAVFRWRLARPTAKTSGEVAAIAETQHISHFIDC